MKAHVNGIECHYTLEGPDSAPVILFSHSLATHHGMWYPQIETFAQDYRVLCYDVRGHGETTAPKGPYTLELLAEDALALLDTLGISQAHWVGISMGGMIGQVFALTCPDRLISLCLCDTTSEIPAEAHPVWNERIDTARTRGMEPLIEPTIDRWFSPGYVQQERQTVDHIRDMIRATPTEGFIGCARAIMQLGLTERLAEIRLPTLIIVGEDDPGTPVSASEVIQGRINGSELVILPVARHLTSIERAEEYNRALRAFLDASA